MERRVNKTMRKLLKISLFYLLGLPTRMPAENSRVDPNNIKLSVRLFTIRSESQWQASPRGRCYPALNYHFGGKNNDNTCPVED